VNALETAAAVFALAYFARRKAGAPPQAFKNGKAIDVELVQIDELGHLLEFRAAQAFATMREAAARDGVALVVESAFRTMEQQTLLWVSYQRGERSDVVGPPGYSNHQSGEAVDVTTARGTNAAFDWLTRNAHLYSFRRTVASEPWHWEFRA
jgi:LAS superfamily LD-carboxypeptidase LdcB